MNWVSVLKRVGKIAWKWGRWIVLILGAAIFLNRVIRARVAPVRRRLGFVPVERDFTRIDVIEEDGSTVRVKLPGNVRSEDVIAAGVSEDGQWAIEVQHVSTNRRGVHPDADGGGSLDL